MSDARGGKPAKACGYEATGHAAEAKAIASAGPHARPLPAKWASGYRRPGSVKPRASRTEEGGEGASRVARVGRGPRGQGGTARLEFLYTAREGDRDESPGLIVVDRHRIVKKTARKIYVDREPFREDRWGHRGEEGDEASGHDREARPMVVDRSLLRQEGRYRDRHSHHALYFYATEEDGIRDVAAALESAHPWCATLGLGFPCSVDDVKSAYRRLAKGSHPDRGGNPTSFIAVEQAYREALAYFERPIDPP
jgi:hypothetical protein